MLTADAIVMIGITFTADTIVMITADTIAMITADTIVMISITPL